MQKDQLNQENELNKLSLDVDFSKILDSDKTILPQIMALEKFSSSGRTFYFVVDIIHKQYLYVSESVEMVTGYTQQECMEKGIQFSFDICHPDDRKLLQKVNNCTKNWLDELLPHQKTNFEFSNNFRIRHLEGHTVKILRQTRFLRLNEKGKPTLLLGICQDFTPFKTDDNIVLAMRGYDEVEKKMVEKQLVFYPEIAAFQISDRELAVLRCIHQGLSNQKITEKLFISMHTVKSHRKNMLSKTGCGTMQELIYKAQQQGLFA